ncbi:MAG: hypothetical protein JW754_04820 [Candidatus Aenigmarchaeota archaeon]|nr:hypothetical protein [Candidatus Aenigmarchaeota archaeon]
MPVRDNIFSLGWEYLTMKDPGQKADLGNYLSCRINYRLKGFLRGDHEIIAKKILGKDYTL